MKQILSGIVGGVVAAMIVFAAGLAADGITISQGSGTTLATDTIGGAEYQRYKLTLGADGTADEDLQFKEITWSSASYAESSITASYTDALEDTNGKRGCILQNLTDADLTISFDGTNGYRLPAQFEKEFTWGDQWFKETGDVQVKYVTNPSSGTLEVLCWF